jgi:hypothetical protein
MESIIFFVMFSAIWAGADHFLAPPIKGFLEKNGIGPKNDVALTGISECIVGIALGSIAGYNYGPILAVSFHQTAWSWIATGCLIGTSFIFSN